MYQSKIKDHLSLVKDTLQIEANAILNLMNQLGNETNEAIELILKCENRVIITGMGKSGIIGKKMAATLASTGTPSFFIHPGEALHGDLGMVTNNDIVVVISNSGETDEIINIIPSIKRIGAKIVSIVGEKYSTLALTANVVINIGKVQEACPLGLAPTTSTTLTLALGDAIAIAVLKEKNFKPENFALFHPGGSLGRKLLLSVEDILNGNKKNPCVSMDVNVKDALFTMTAHGLGATNVVNNKKELVGILTDGDIRRLLTVEGTDILNEPITNLFNKKPTTITSDLLASEAMRIMEDKKISVLPVVNEYFEPVAMIHVYDLTKLGV